MRCSQKLPIRRSLGSNPRASVLRNLWSKGLPHSPILVQARNACDKSPPMWSPVMSSMAARERLDVLVWQRGLAPRLARARALILAGQIAVNGAKTTRAGTPVDLAATLTRLGAISPYVSRGGEKLAAALAAFDLT